MSDQEITVMTAWADQVIASRRDFLGQLVNEYRNMVAAEGKDPAVASGIIACAADSTINKRQASQLLAVAVMMLAEAPDRPVTP